MQIEQASVSVADTGERRLLGGLTQERAQLGRVPLRRARQRARLAPPIPCACVRAAAAPCTATVSHHMHGCVSGRKVEGGSAGRPARS